MIKDNRIRIELAVPACRQMIFANTSAAAGILFKRLIVTGNEIQDSGPASTRYAIDLRRIQHSVVAGNTVRGVTNGISLAGDLLANEVRDNLVEASGVAYEMSGSLGGNKAIQEQVSEQSKNKWRVFDLKGSGSVKAVLPRSNLAPSHRRA